MCPNKEVEHCIRHHEAPSRSFLWHGRFVVQGDPPLKGGEVKGWGCLGCWTREICLEAIVVVEEQTKDLN